MRAILIDPVERTIRVIDHNPANYKDTCAAIHADIMQPVELLQGDAVMIDEEGRINGNGENIGGFQLVGPGGTVECAGYGIVLGYDDDGDERDAKAPVSWVIAHVRWLDADWFKANPPPPMTFQTFDTNDELLAAMGLKHN